MYRDQVVKGLVLRVMKTGHRAWIVERRRKSGSKKETPLGPGDALTLAEARENALKVLADYTEQELKEEVLRGNTLASAFSDYCIARRIPEQHAKEYRRALEIYGAALWKLPLEKITRNLVLKIMKNIEDGVFEPGLPYTPKNGGRAKSKDFIRYGAMIYAWAEPKLTNPFHGIDTYESSNPRENYVFQPRDWPAIFDFADRLGGDDRDLFLLQLMLGTRPLATSRLRWDRLDLEKGTYNLTNDKEECMGWKPAKSPSWKYPLDDHSVNILRQRKEFTRRGTFVFESHFEQRSGNPITTRVLERLFKELREHLHLPVNCVPYSTRYTRATYSEIAFGNTQITSRLLNHRIDTRNGVNATPGYITTGDGLLTLGDESDVGYSAIKHCANRYSEILLELGGRKELSDKTREIFKLAPDYNPHKKLT